MKHPNGRTLITACALAVSLLALTLVARGHFVNERLDDQDTTDAELCLAIGKIIRASDPRELQPGDPGYDYYRSHPDELAQAIVRTDDAMDELPCEPPP